MKKASVSKVNGSFELVCDDLASDKSISHRCAIFSLLSDQESKISNFLIAEDTLDSLKIASMLGARVQRDKDEVLITPINEIKEPDDILYCGNAGTGMRLYCGLLAGVEGSFVLSGDKYLNSRPMKRVTNPLRQIGAKVDGRDDGNLAPLHIRGQKLESFDYTSPIDSAQVKSAMILAGLKANGKSLYKEPSLSRDHTERMLKGMGADIKKTEDGAIEISPLKSPLKPLNIRVPADPSSGFFFAVAAAITPDAKVIIKDTTLNPTRIEAFNILKEMGAEVEFIEKENIYEPIGDIIVSHTGKLKSVRVDKNIAWLIDELPALSIAMAVADGISQVRNAKELRVKESDRISSVVKGLRNCQIEVKEYEDGYDIVGGSIKKSTINSYGDHRVAMSFAIGGLIDGMEIEDIDCINTSFPNFFEILSKITNITVQPLSSSDMGI
jgi:3-phosphoshikimate 1-carboxyvinyltransferase